MARYAMDVNTERAEDVLTHKRMLEEAKRVASSGSPVLFVRPVRVSAARAVVCCGLASSRSTVSAADNNSASSSDRSSGTAAGPGA
jgi:hypothetical protein